MSSVILPCLGLAPDSNALATPKGSLRHAENVVCDLPGIARARPNFELGTNKSTAYTPTAMHVYGSTRILKTFSGATHRLETETGTITGAATEVDFDSREMSFAEARENLYFCTSTGVRVLRGEASTASDAAGLDVASLISPRRSVLFAQTTVPADPGWSAAWCWVVKRTDANGYVRRSPPSTRWVYRLASGTSPPTMPLTIAEDSTSSGSSATVFAFSSGALVAGDEVEFYRTTFVGSALGTPAADMYLTTVYKVTAADVAAGVFPTGGTVGGGGPFIKDARSDADLGEALYTNPQREGALAAKYGPPIAQEIAHWSRCMWYGRTKDRHRLTVSLVAAGQDNATVAYRMRQTTDSIGTHATNAFATGDFAVGTNTILNMSNTTGMKVGDVISDGSTSATEDTGTLVPANTTISSISGSTITMSANALGTSAGATVRCYSAVVIDTVVFRAEQYTRLGPNGAGFTSYKAFGTSVLAANADRAEATAAELVKAINAAQAAGLVTVRAFHVGGLGAPVGASGGGGEIVIERTALSGASFTLASGTSNAWTPQAAAALTSTQDDKPHRVYFSLPDEPEAVPLLNYIDIGSEAAPIQRLIPLNTALLVFKEDGLFRITGSAPDNWSVDQLDTTLRLIRPEACAVLNEKAYAWTNRGVVVVDEAGVGQSISAGKIDAELFTAQGTILGDTAYHGCRILTSPRHNLVLLTIPDVFVESPVYYSDLAYCYSEKTGAWTKWPELYARCGATGTNGVLWIAANNALDELEWETRYLLDTPRGYDRNYVISAWTATASSTAMSITNAQRGEWVPTVGDWVYWAIGSVYWRRIIAVVDDGGGDYSWTLDSAAPSNIGSAAFFGAVVGTPILLEWLPSAMGTGGISLGPWREITFQIDGEAQVKVSPTDFRITFGVRHDGVSTVATVTATPDRSTVQMRPYRIGWPRNGSRRAIAAPRLSWSEIDWPWRLSGIALIGETGSERVRQ